MVVRKRELLRQGYPPGFLDRAFRARGQRFAWKMNPLKKNSPICLMWTGLRSGKRSKQKEGVMSRFKVGDLVRVREWDDMKKEFGSDGDLTIYCKCLFVDMMKSTCGDVCTIKDLTESGNYKLSGKNESGWIYSEDMLYPAITYREYAEKVDPKRIESFHYGGVEGCPFSLSGMCQSRPDFLRVP